MGRSNIFPESCFLRQLNSISAEVGMYVAPRRLLPPGPKVISWADTLGTWNIYTTSQEDNNIQSPMTPSLSRSSHMVASWCLGSHVFPNNAFIFSSQFLSHYLNVESSDCITIHHEILHLIFCGFSPKAIGNKSFLQGTFKSF